MIIYLEGVDGSGKSTLAKHIYNTLKPKGYKVMLNAEMHIPTHPKSLNRISKDKLFEELEEMANNNNMVYILDRGPISDCVYRVFDDYKPVVELPELIMFLMKIDNMLLIHCKTEKAKINMLERGDTNPIAIQKHKEISKVYDLVISMIDSIDTLVYDYDKMLLNNFLISVEYFVFEMGGIPK